MKGAQLRRDAQNYILTQGRKFNKKRSNCPLSPERKSEYLVPVAPFPRVLIRGPGVQGRLSITTGEFVRRRDSHRESKEKGGGTSLPLGPKRTVGPGKERGGC